MINILKQAWAIFKQNYRILLWTTFILLVVEFLFTALVDSLSVQSSAIYFYPVFLIGLLLRLTLVVCFMQLAFRLIDGETVRLASVFSVPMKTIGQGILVTILLMVGFLVPLALIFGLALSLGLFYSNFWLTVLVSVVIVIVWGFYFSIKTFSALSLVVDKKLNAFSAIKTSWVISRGDTWLTFKVMLTQALLVIIGVLALLLGLLVAVPLVMLMTAFTYRQMAAKELPVQIS